MPRKYIRKTQRGSYGSDALQSALREIEAGASLNSVSQKYGIDRKTLRRHRDGKVAAPGAISLGRFKPQFNEVFEQALCNKIKAMESMLFGLTTMDVRRLAFDLAENLGLEHRFNESSKLAGKDWLSGFLERNKNSISIRRPEAVSLSRAVGFNKVQVDRFFVCYKSILQKSPISASRVWNVDETGFSCVQKPSKILAEKGKKAVGKITSAERGKNVTAICAFNAAGNFIPPMIIYPRKRLPPAMMMGAPADSLGSCSDNGWSDGEQFLKWLEHFAKHAKPSKQEPHVLILDGHHSHKTLAAVEYATEQGIHMITLPPHSSHKMQPCDRTFFKPLKAAYNSAADNWMVSHPAQRITFFDIASIFGQAYQKAATVAVAVNGFAACGLWPFNDNIFTETDFAPSKMTEVPEPATQDKTTVSALVPTFAVSTSVASHSTASVTGTATSSSAVLATEPNNAASSSVVSSCTASIFRPVATSTTSAETPSPMVSSSSVTLSVPCVVVSSSAVTESVTIAENSTAIIGSVTSAATSLAKVSTISACSTDSVCAVISTTCTESTSTPIASSSSSNNSGTSLQNHAEMLLEELCASPKASKERKRTRKAESSQIITSSPFKRSLMEKKALKKEPAKKQSTITKGKGKGKKAKKAESESSDEEYPCLVCGESFANSRPREKWVACTVCRKWSHEDCTPGMGIYICQNCDSDDEI